MNEVAGCEVAGCEVAGCEVAGCEVAGYARGLCSRHYRQQLRRGAVQPDPTPQRCRTDGCSRQAVTRGWCHGHYLRWHRTGDDRPQVPLARPVRGRCAVAECGRQTHSRGLCRTHVERLRIHRDLHAARPITVAGPGSISHGYRKVVVPAELLHLTAGERNVLEHRLVMAQLLGRPLGPQEVVHHRNGDRLDNRPGNLELWSVDQPKGQRVADKVAYAVELLNRYASELLLEPRPAEPE